MMTARRAICWLMTSALVVSTVLVLGSSRIQYCGRLDAGPPRVDAVATRWPTPAPPQEIVFVHVETDRPDLQIGWAEK